MKRQHSQKPPISLKKGAVFLGDAHYHPGLREELEAFLNGLQAPQLFLMGDIFDLLVGGVRHSLAQNRSLIDLLNRLSLECEIIYLEGNHDFLLQEIFPHIHVVPLFAQPLVIPSAIGDVALAHGDNFIDGGYRLYRSLLYSRKVIALLDALDVGGWISERIQRYNAAKNLCKKIEDFDKIAKKRVANYKTDIIIEGHYHQRCICDFGAKRYINLASFACGGEYLCFDGEGFTFCKS